MRTSLTDEFVLAVKDQLRSMRYRVQRGARGQGPLASRAEALMPASIAVATDTVFSQMTAAAASFLPKDEVALYAYPFPQSAVAYFATDRDDMDALTPKIYSAVKALLWRFGSDVFLVSEQGVREACNNVRAQQDKTISAVLNASLDPTEQFDACVRLCAALSIALVSAHPVREVIRAPTKRDALTAPFLAPNEYCAFVIGLAIALSSRPDVKNVDPQSLAEAADFAVHARMSELSEALKSRQPVAALAAEFNGLLRFLP